MKHWPQLEAQMLNSRCACVLKDRRVAVGICGIDRLESDGDSRSQESVSGPVSVKIAFCGCSVAASDF